MIFNLKIKSAQQLNIYSKNSAEILFSKSNADFDKLLKVRRYQVNDIQKSNFREEDNSEIRLWKNDNPNLVIFKKTEVNKKFNVDLFRNYLAGVVKDLEKLKISNLIVNVPEYKQFNKIFKTEEYFYQSLVEGTLLGNYSFNIYKSDKAKPKNMNIIFLAKNKRQFDKSIFKAKAVVEGVIFARDLVNEPSNVLTPAEYAKRVRSEFRGTNISVKVFNEKELAKRKMNAILSVGRASVNKPRLIQVHYKPANKNSTKIALVGKGVTYDTGGLSIKSTAAMLEMKADMAGSATVFGIVKTASLLKLPLEIIGIVPAVENAISGDSYKPGDIISSLSGKTIEVKDTDAEGRIILADALEYASKLKPDEIIDFATLTGAVAVALGLFTAGIFTKNDEMSKKIIEASEITYEHAWRLPFWDEFNKLIESKIADVSNLGPRWGGAITAGKFLEHFVDENIPWTHIDLAGPALQHDLTNYTKNYCTGYGVRLITKYLEQ